MRVLFDASANIGTRVGLARFTENVARHLSARCDLTVLTWEPSLFAECDCNTIAIPHRRLRLPQLAFWQFIGLGLRASRNWDVLLCPTPVVPLGVRIPSVAVVHDLIPLKLPRLHASRYKALFWLGLQSARMADRLLAVSEHTKSDLVRWGIAPADRISVIYSGLSLDPAQPDIDFGSRFAPYILHVGGHLYTKNVRRLISAFAALKGQTSTRLVVVGWGMPEQVLSTRRHVERLALSDRVTMLSDITDAQLSSLYRHCEVFVCPSLYEGFGLPVLEALAHGVPTACSNSASLPEVAGCAAVYFTPSCSNDIAAAVRRLLTDAGLRTRFHELGPLRAKRFSWQTTAQAVLAACQDAAR